jgi:hypothetical protein
MTRGLLSTVTIFGIAISSLTSCDSLWTNFTKEDPSSCDASSSQCSASTAIRVDSIIPQQVPYSGGQPVTINGSGFLPKTDVMLAMSLLGNQKTESDLKISGTVPAAPGRCGKVDLTLKRADGAQLLVPNAFTYTLDPYYGKIPTNPQAYISITNNMIINDFDLDQQLDLALSLGNQIVIYSGFGTPAQKLLIPFSSISSSYIQPIHFSTATIPKNNGFINLDGTRKTLAIYSLNPATGGFDTNNAFGFQYEARFVLTGDLDQNGNDTILVITSSLNDTTMDSFFIAKFNTTSSKYQPELTPVALQKINRIDSIIFADITNDKYPDIITSTNGRIITLKRDGAEGPELVKNPNALLSLTAGDWNGDGKIDIAGIEVSTMKLVMALNNDNGAWPILSIDAGITAASQSTLIAGEMNCDGKKDIMIMPTGDTGAVVKIASLNPLGQIEVKNTAQNLPNGPAVLGDFNSDGFPDIAVSKNISGTGSRFYFIPGAIP